MVMLQCYCSPTLALYKIMQNSISMHSIYSTFSHQLQLQKNKQKLCSYICCSVIVALSLVLVPKGKTFISTHSMQKQERDISHGEYSISVLDTDSSKKNLVIKHLVRNLLINSAQRHTPHSTHYNIILPREIHTFVSAKFVCILHVVQC